MRSSTGDKPERGSCQDEAPRVAKPPTEALSHHPCHRTVREALRVRRTSRRLRTHCCLAAHNDDRRPQSGRLLIVFSFFSYLFSDNLYVFFTITISH